MSADRQRLKSAIQQIAKEGPEIRRLLGDGKNKGGKASSAGVGVSDAERDRICCDGSTSTNANLGTSERDPDATDAGQTGLDSSDPADLTSGDGTLSGVTECTTGEPICLDGAGFIPPAGWDAPDDPPVIDDYDSSVYIKVVWDQCCSDSNGNIRCPENYYFQTCSQAKEFLQTQVPGLGIPSCNTTAFCYIISTISCSTTSDPQGIATCDMPPPTEDYWPSDSCVNLSIAGGKIVGSKYDPDNDGSYSAPRDSIDLCDSEGNQISLAPAANGGWKTINSTTNNGYLYDSSGKQIAHIDGNEYSDPSV